MSSIAEVNSDLRQYLTSLDEVELGVLAGLSDTARAGAALSVRDRGGRPLGRRACRAMKVWLAKASAQSLAQVCREIVHVAGTALVGRYSFPAEVVDDPDVEQLTHMLVRLGSPVARLSFFGLLLNDAFNAHAVAWENRSELAEAVRDVGRRSVFVELVETDVKTELNGPDASKSDAVDTNQYRADAPSLDAVADLLADARRTAALLAGHLEETADVVRTGAPVPASLLTAVDEYKTGRRGVLDAVAGHELVTDDSTFDDIERAIAQLRAAAREEELKRTEAARRRELEELERTIEALKRRRDGLISDTDSLGHTVEQPDPADVAAEIAVEEPETAEHVVIKESGVSVPGTLASEAVPPQETRDSLIDAQGAEGGERLGDDLEHGFPWEQGDPPVAVELVGNGRLAEAYWVTFVSGEPDRRTTILRFATMAYATRDAAEATTVQSALDIDAQSLHSDIEAAALAATSTIRVGLLAGWAHPLLSMLCSELTLPEPWRELIDACVAAARAGYRVDRAVSTEPVKDDGHLVRAELGRRARELVHDLPRRRNTYERATRVLRRMSAKDEPLHVALTAVIDWSVGVGSQEVLAAAAERLGRAGAADQIIESADAAERTPKQAKEPIVSTALRGLRRAVDEVTALVREADVVSRRLMSASDHAAEEHQLQQAVVDVSEAETPPGMVGAALDLLRRWLLEPVPAPWQVTPGESEPSVDVLLPLADLPRDGVGRPKREDPRVSAELARLIGPMSIAAAVRSYCDRGDLHRATRTLELAEQGVWQIDEDITDLRSVIDQAFRRWEGAHRQALIGAQDMFARIRGQNLLDQQVVSEVGRRLEALSQVVNAEYDQAMREIDNLVADLHAIRQRHVEGLRETLKNQHIADEADRARIAALLDEGDTVTAAEFLSFIRAGSPLPVHANPVEQDVATFVQLLAEGERSGLVKTPFLSQPWADLAAGDEPLAETAVNGLTAWDALSNPNRHAGDRLGSTIRDVLGTLGLYCSNRPRELNQGARRGFRQYRVQAKPADLSYVAALGSSARDFTVTIVSDERRGRSLLDVLGHGDAGRANIIFYLRPLDLASRRSLAAESANSAVQALVIDPAVLGWVAAKRPGSWRGTQRVTLPWTAMNPYTPFVAGLVPPEVFVGRANEMAAVTDPTGGLFVYGGRQLGKSALLRRVEATFDDEFRHAVYLDLKGRGIGEAEPAERIWRELVVELKERGLLSHKVSKDAPADVVVDQVRGWLNANPARRLLLLADEADAFLTADSRAVPRAGGVGHFPNVLRLKELMESTERRFKVVFAGLHQVQRFGHLSNVPLAHGGPDILVGPLDSRNARKLVEEPMAALGYVFEQPELVWRLLAATNYQASLIQIFCDELVTTLHRRVNQFDTFPIPVSGEDLERVAASDRVRARIAERLRITINLEDRYRVLTLVIALLSLTDSFGSDYDAQELLDHARIYWPDGFDDLTVSQVGIYLDEMVGLGLLVRLPGTNRYAVRSPNVVNMLGTKATLERELAETDFMLPYEYNPREARRLLHVDEKERRQWRSPLTDGQLAELVSGTTSVVTGTEALGVRRLSQAVQEYAETRGLLTEVCGSPAEVASAATTASRRKKRTVIFADLRGRSLTELRDVVSRLNKYSSVTSALLVEPSVADGFATDLGQVLVRPERWTEGAIRSWPECPFESVESRRRLIRATGGWPELVEAAISQVARGATQAQALQRIQRVTSDKEQAGLMLTDAGIGGALIERLAPWVDFMLPDDPVPFVPGDVADILDLSVAATNDMLTELSVLGVLDEYSGLMALDGVIYRCLATVCNKS